MHVARAKSTVWVPEGGTAKRAARYVDGNANTARAADDGARSLVARACEFRIRDSGCRAANPWRRPETVGRRQGL